MVVFIIPGMALSLPVRYFVEGRSAPSGADGG